MRSGIVLAIAFAVALGGAAPSTAGGSADPIEQMRRAVSVRIVSKGFAKADYRTGMHDRITVKFVFTNGSGKDIRGFRGTIVFRDISGVQIKSIQLSSYEGLKAGQQKTWDGVLDYDPFMAEDRKLRDTPIGNLKVEWNPQTILFANGTKLGR